MPEPEHWRSFTFAKRLAGEAIDAVGGLAGAGSKVRTCTPYNFYTMRVK